MKMYSKLLILLTVFFWVVGYNKVYAEPICIAITAEVAYVDDYGDILDGAINVDDVITGVYVYESTTPDTNSASTVGDYWHTTAPFGITLNAGGLIFSTDPNNVEFLVEIVNDHGSPMARDNYLLRSYSNIFDVGSNIETHIAWQLDDPTTTALSSQTLPTLPPVLTDWQSIFGLTIDSESEFFIRAHVTTAKLCGKTPQKVTICHKPGTRAERTLFLPPPAILKHLKHGDILGACP